MKPLYILKGCKRCGGDLVWDLLDQCYSCFQCGNYEYQEEALPYKFERKRARVKV